MLYRHNDQYHHHHSNPLDLVISFRVWRFPQISPVQTENRLSFTATLFLFINSKEKHRNNALIYTTTFLLVSIIALVQFQRSPNACWPYSRKYRRFYFPRNSFLVSWESVKASLLSIVEFHWVSAGLHLVMSLAVDLFYVFFFFSINFFFLKFRN